MFNPLNIKNILADKRLIYKDVYVGAGISESTFKGIMSKGGNPSANLLESLADFLECSIDDFFDRKYKVVRTADEGKGNESILYQMCKEKDIELMSMSREIGELSAENKILRERLENLNAEITLIKKLSSGSQAAEYAKNADVQKKGMETR